MSQSPPEQARVKLVLYSACADWVSELPAAIFTWSRYLSWPACHIAAEPEYNCECVYAVCAHYSGHNQYLGSVNVIIIIL